MNNYYPFGLEHKGYNAFTSPSGNDKAEQRKFGGKEHQSELGLGWYDITARNYDPALGRWMNIDILAEVAHSISMTPYHFVANNPILNVDIDGKDWFEDKDGNLHWNKRTGKDGDTYEDEDGNEYTNIGDELLLFDGDNLHYFTQSENKDGDLVMGRTSVGAVSGREEGGEFNYSDKRQATKDKGPIPEGDYTIYPSSIQSYDDLSFSQKVASYFNRGLWPMGTYAWGENRVWVNPSAVEIIDPETGEKITRTDMSIHGGDSPGSAGCIDCHKNAPKFFDALKKSKSKSIRLRVVYPNSKKD